MQGVSTRKVTKITDKLCGTGFSKSAVSRLCESRLCEELDVRVRAWNERPLDGKRYPFLLVDAMQIKVRRDEAVRSTSALVAIGINEEGYREVLGLDIGDSESEGTWERLFKRLKARGLRGVELITSDSHGGLVKAARRQFQGAAWQRCQTHLMRNVLGQTPRHLKAEMTAWLRRIFRSESQAGSAPGLPRAEPGDGRQGRSGSRYAGGRPRGRHCRTGPTCQISQASSDNQHGRTAHRGDPSPGASHPHLSE